MSVACLYFLLFRDDHPENVLSSMQTIMVVLLEESEDIREDLLEILLSSLGREKKVSTKPYHAAKLWILLPFTSLILFYIINITICNFLSRVLLRLQGSLV